MNVTTVALDSPANLFALSPDGRLVAVVRATSLVVIDVATRVERARAPVAGAVYACNFTHDGRALVVGTRAPTVFDVASSKTEKATFKGPKSAPNAVEFSRDGAKVFFANGSFMAPHDCCVYAYDLATRRIAWTRTLSLDEGNTDLAVLGDRVVVFDERGAAHVLDAATGAPRARAQLVPPVPDDESQLRGACVDDDTLLAASLDGDAAVVLCAQVGADAVTTRWRTTVTVPGANPEELLIVGRPCAVGSAAYVPISWCLGDEPRVSLAALDLATGALLDLVALDGCQSHLAVAIGADGALVWASGAAAFSIGAVPTR